MKEGESEVGRNEGREGKKEEREGGRECAADLAGAMKVEGVNEGVSLPA